MVILNVDLSQSIKDVGGVHAGVVCELTGNNFEGLSEGTDNHLLFTTNCTHVFTQESRKFHLDGATSSDDGVSLNSSENDHYGIIEGACSLLNILRGATSDDDSHGLGAGALSEHIVALISELNLFEFSADTEN